MSDTEAPTWTVVEVEWLDHAFHWGPYENQGLSRQRSTGYLLKETGEIIVLAQSIQVDDGDPTPKPAEVLVLGRSMVTGMRRL